MLGRGMTSVRERCDKFLERYDKCKGREYLLGRGITSDRERYDKC